MKSTISKLILAFLMLCLLKVEAAGLSDLTAMYNVYQGATDQGDHGFTIDFDRYSWEKQWSYGGRIKYIKKYAARDPFGVIKYKTITESNVDIREFSICSGGACDVPFEVRNYSCKIPSNDLAGLKRSFVNSDADESLKSQLHFIVSHRYVVNPSKDYRELFEQNKIWAVLEAPAETSDSFCCNSNQGNPFTVKVPFQIKPNSTRLVVEFKSPYSFNYQISSGSGIVGGLDSNVFK